MFAAWQMGMVYFSGQTMSVDGRTPLPVEVGNVTVIIAAGYILSILVMIFIPGITVWTERITAGAALLSVLALYLPLPLETLALALYLQYFCCCFMIGFETALIVGIFKERTALLHLTVAYGVSSSLIAALHNEFIPPSFSVFRLFAAAALVLMLIFFFRLPGRSWPRNVKKTDGLRAPWPLFWGVLFWTLMTCFVILFGIAVAEGRAHGVFVYYLANAAAAFMVYLLWKRLGVSPFRTVTVMAALGAIGFVLAIASLHLKGLALAACALLGAGSAPLSLNPFFGAVLFAKRYPSRFIAPGIIGVAFLTVLLHTALLETFRDLTTVRYAVYLIIAVCTVILFLILEPYLMYAFRGKSIFLETLEDRRPEQGQGEKAGKSDGRDNRARNLAEEAFENLTGQELRVAELLLRGYSFRGAAEELSISLNTAKGYGKNLYAKLGVHSMRELFALAEQRARMRGSSGIGNCAKPDRKP
jgi:DNA-binding CsgD family transcriptional regulator